MAKKEFDIEKYNKSKILSPKKYKVWLSQIQAKENNEEEMAKLKTRLEVDINDAKYRRQKLFSKWWLKELVSAGAIVGLAFLVNFLTPFSPFSFLVAGAALLAVINVVAFGIIPGIRFLTNKYKGLVNFQNELDKQNQLEKANSKEMINDLSDKKQKIQTKEKVEHITNIDVQEKVFQPEEPSNVSVPLRPVLATNENAKMVNETQNQNIVNKQTEIIEDKTENTENVVEVKANETENKVEEIQEETTPVRKSLEFNFGPKQKYVFRVKTRTMTADGACPNEDICVNISTTDLDKFIEELNKKMFEEKGFKTSRTQKAKKATSMVLTVKNAKELIDAKLANKEITAKQAEKQKSQIASVVLVFEITNMSNPAKGTVESRPYQIEEEKDFFQTVEKVKNRVLQQANELKESKSSQETY